MMNKWHREISRVWIWMHRLQFHVRCIVSFGLFVGFIDNNLKQNIITRNVLHKDLIQVINSKVPVRLPSCHVLNALAAARLGCPGRLNLHV